MIYECKCGDHFIDRNRFIEHVQKFYASKTAAERHGLTFTEPIRAWNG